MKYLLDTDICIFLLRGKPAGVQSRFEKIPFGDIGISAITCSELRHGAEKSSNPASNHQTVTEFLAPLEMLDYPAEAAMTYGRLRNALQKQGRMIGPLDLLIASHAIHLNVTLVTNNTSEFSRVPNLRIENWIHS